MTPVSWSTLDGWRYALYFVEPSGVTDDALHDPVSEPASEPGTAQAACHRKAEELTRRHLEISWRASDQPDTWTGAVVSAGPRPPA
ncbi:hypothetical protein [Streptomyces buecherae]|uniref:hypothetical protein n=1 Tax=Streptomyces buecherae TaxID=2763006 RepID=UPI001C257CC1|nr:hypothetical protein [Streptomyces buecherae]